MFGYYGIHSTDYRLLTMIGVVKRSPARRYLPGPKRSRLSNIGYLYIHSDKEGCTLYEVIGQDGSTKDLLGTGRVPLLALKAAMVEWLNKRVRYVGDGTEHSKHRAAKFAISKRL